MVAIATEETLISVFRSDEADSKREAIEVQVPKPVVGIGGVC